MHIIGQIPTPAETLKFIIYPLNESFLNIVQIRDKIRIKYLTKFVPVHSMKRSCLYKVHSSTNILYIKRVFPRWMESSKLFPSK